MKTNEYSQQDTYVIADRQTLRTFKEHSRRINRRGSYNDIQVTAPVLGRERIECRMNRAYRTCGCLTGGITALLVIGLMIYLHVSAAGWTMPEWPKIGLGIAIAFTSAAVGKVSGVVHAQITLRRLIAKLEREIGTNERRDSK